MAKFNKSDLSEHRSNFLQALEELKYHRTECLEQQYRIEHLFVEKLDTEQILCNTREKLKNAEIHSEKLQSEIAALSTSVLEPKYKDKIKKLEEAVEMAERTVASTKKEVSRLSLSKHQLENNLKQMDQKATSSEKRADVALERLRSIEIALQALTSQVTELTKAQSILRKNVDAATSLNREVVRMCSRKNCLLLELKAERDGLKSELHECEAKLRADSGGIQLDEKETEMRQLRKQLHLLKKQNSSHLRDIDKTQDELAQSRLVAKQAHEFMRRSEADVKNIFDLKSDLNNIEKEKCNWQLKYEQAIEDNLQCKLESHNKIAELNTKMEANEKRLNDEIENLHRSLDATKVELTNERMKTENDCRLEERLKEVELQLQIAQTENEDIGKSRRLNQIKKIGGNENRKSAPVEKALSEKHAQTGMKPIGSVKIRAAIETSASDLSYAADRRATCESLKEKEARMFGEESQMTIDVQVEDEENKVHDQSPPSCEEKRDGECQNKGMVSPSVSRVQAVTTTRSPCILTGKSSAVVQDIYNESAIKDALRQKDSHKQPGAVVEDNSAIVLNSTGGTNKEVGAAASSGAITSGCEPPRELFQFTDSLAETTTQNEQLDDTLSGSRLPENYETATNYSVADYRNRENEVEFDQEEGKSHVHMKNECESAGRCYSNELPVMLEASQKILSKKRKLSSTPPMLDASQGSLMESGDDSVLATKPSSLKVPKQFIKQVLSNRRQPTRLENRTRPLAFIMGKPASFHDRYSNDGGMFHSDVTGNHLTADTPAKFVYGSVLQQHTDVHSFAKDYTTLKSRFSLGGDMSSKQYESLVDDISGKPDSSGSYSTKPVPYRRRFEPPAFQLEDQDAIEVCESV